MVRELASLIFPPFAHEDLAILAGAFFIMNDLLPASLVAGLFYVPLAASWIGRGLRHSSLSLPSAANPAIVTGGMWGESKSSYFAQLSDRRWVADFVVVPGGEAARAEAQLAAAGLSYPIVAKPDIGWQGFGVRRIDNAAMLRDHLAAFPPDGAVMLQRFVSFAHEAAVLYAREPGAPRGRVVSLTLRILPFVTGDGAASVRELILRDPRARWKAHLHLGRDRTHRGLDAAALARVPARGEMVQLSFLGNQRAGALYRDLTRRVTLALHARFDGIAAQMPGFH